MSEKMKTLYAYLCDDQAGALGVGTVSVSYDIEHITTEGRLMADISPRAMYTRLQTLTFNDNEVEKTFLLPIHNDITKVSPQYSLTGWKNAYIII